MAKEISLYKWFVLGGLSLFLLLPYNQFITGSLPKQILVTIIILWSIVLWDLMDYKASCIERPLVCLSKLEYLYCAAVFLALLLYQFKFLSAPIAWKGDEEFHIRRAVGFEVWMSRTILARLTPISITLLIFITAYFLIKKYCGNRYQNYLFIVLLPILSFVLRPTMNKNNYLILGQISLRYPPLKAIFETLFANSLFSTLYSETAHRLSTFVPYFAIFIIAFLIARSLELESHLVYLLPVVLITSPLLYYYGTVNYIEPLVVFIQFLVLFEIIRQPEITLAFLFKIAVISSITGVIKENAVPFLGAVAIFFTYHVISDNKIQFPKKLKLIFRLGYMTFLPMSLYLFFRMSVMKQRGYAAQFSNFLNPTTYYTYLLAINGQLTMPVFILSVIGLIYLYVSKKYTNAFLLSVLNFALYFIFVTSERYDLIGYSRFMLHLIPTFYLGLLGFFLLARTNKYISSLLIVSLIGYNIYSSPLTFTARSNWEVCSYGANEYYLPYPQAIKYLADNYPEDHSFIATGMNYGYSFYPYKKKFGVKQTFLGQYLSGGRWYVSNEGGRKPLDLEASVAVAKREKADLFLFHNLNSLTAPKKDLQEGRFVKRFTLENNSVDIYEIVDTSSHVYKEDI